MYYEYENHNDSAERAWACEERRYYRERRDEYAYEAREDARGEYLAARAEYAEHCCHGAGCEAEPEDTRQCEECGVYFCADHLAGDKCAGCVRDMLTTEKRAA